MRNFWKNAKMYVVSEIYTKYENTKRYYENQRKHKPWKFRRPVDAKKKDLRPFYVAPEEDELTKKFKEEMKFLESD